MTNILEGSPHPEEGFGTLRLALNGTLSGTLADLSTAGVDKNGLPFSDVLRATAQVGEVDEDDEDEDESEEGDDEDESEEGDDEDESEEGDDEDDDPLLQGWNPGARGLRAFNAGRVPTDPNSRRLSKPKFTDVRAKLKQFQLEEPTK